MRRALIFDCDGVLVDGEQQAHLLAFNQMWRDQGIPWQWTREEYARKLRISGGKERLESLYYDHAFRSVVPIPEDIEEWRALVKQWHTQKTQIYMRVIASGILQPRPGVRRLAEEAIQQNWAVAVASSGAKESVEAIVRTVMDEYVCSSIAVFAGDIVVKKKPAPDIYRVAAEALQVPPHHCIAIEDSYGGLVAATTAGMQCIVTPSYFTQNEAFPEATLVLSSLGDPNGEACQFFSNPCRIPVKKYLDIQDLAVLLEKRHDDLSRSYLGLSAGD